MNLFDVRTMVFSYMGTSVICALFVVLLWQQNRNRFEGTGFWVGDFFLQALALVLIVTRGAISDWVSIVFASTLIIIGAILGFVGLERFLGQRRSQTHNYFVVAVFVFAQSYFTFVQPNLGARNVSISVALALVCFQSVWLVWHRAEPSLRSLASGVGTTNLLYVILSLVRIAHFLIAPQNEGPFFRTSLFDSLILISYQALLILLTYSLVLMVNRRLLMQIGIQEEKFAKAFHSAPYAITLTRYSDGTIIDVNRTFTYMTGYERGDVLGKKTIDLKLWEQDADRTAVLDALSKDGDVRAIELQFRKRDGHILIGRYSAEIITIDGIKSILSSIEDITTRKHDEARLQKLSQAVEQSPAATVITDIRGVFEYVNPKFLKVTGYEREELIGKTPAVIKSGLTPPEVYQDLWRTILSGNEWRGEIQNRRKDGELYWEDEMISPIKDTRGAIGHFIAVKEDITERKHSEQALALKHALLLKTERELAAARESLADADRLESVGRLAAGVAHEVKNPLMVIRLGVDCISKQPSQAANREIIDDICGAIERADNVILDLLDFSKPKEFTRQVTTFSQVIDKAINLVKHEIKRRNIAITRDYIGAIPDVYADPGRLVQVFVNLLSNAAQAIGQGGSIQIEMRTKRLSKNDLGRTEAGTFAEGEEVVAIDIRDNGQGFPIEHGKKLFEPFFTTKPVGEGSGLGLAVSRNIVTMHKGSIDISNHADGGVSALLLFRTEREHIAYD